MSIFVKYYLLLQHPRNSWGWPRSTSSVGLILLGHGQLRFKRFPGRGRPRSKRFLGRGHSIFWSLYPHPLWIWLKLNVKNGFENIYRKDFRENWWENNDFLPSIFQYWNMQFFWELPTALRTNPNETNKSERIGSFSSCFYYHPYQQLFGEVSLDKQFFPHTYSSLCVLLVHTIWSKCKTHIRSLYIIFNLEYSLPYRWMPFFSPRPYVWYKVYVSENKEKEKWKRFLVWICGKLI